MKRSLVTLIIMIAISFGNAQVGINTSTPKATLDVGNISTKTIAEGVLIPRVTVLDLESLNEKYNEAQNGALVFVTSTTSGTTSKTSNISGRGFYYYNSTTKEWVSTASNSSAGGGSFTPSFIYITLTSTTSSSAANPIKINWSSYATQYNYFEFDSDTTSEILYYIDFPNAVDFKNKTIYIKSNILNDTDYGLKFSSIPTNLSISGDIKSLKRYSSVKLYSDGANWYLMGGNFSFQ